jgi:hypothetical protein
VYCMKSRHSVFPLLRERKDDEIHAHHRFSC